ncbi:MAG: hypothetical protein E7566_06355 [Ruminococcaceae bacterium]|nr:hypothetical protein [Oscillospiraceae bacterium]
MDKTKWREYTLDGDSIRVKSEFDKDSGIWIEEYVDFETSPRYTPSGHPWKSVTHIGCEYADPVYKDCGTCPWLVKEQAGDLIGICSHENLRLT